ncbi:MAG: RagB/SusD family nutrient uptake outer membrane protein [Bacteroidales bacterium]|nr:RagB/SusD family nutrient uptake outer membrane protein [Bacteroidales bacterium]
MTKLYRIAIAGLVLAAGLTVSCKKDYLDTVPTNSVGASTAVASFNNAIGALNGIALTMCSQQYMSSQGFCGENAIMRLYENYPSENYNYNAYASGWASIHNQTFHSRNNSVYDFYAWYYYYTIIGQANSILANIGNSSATDKEKAFIEASALTFRAYSYQKLLLYYCPRWSDSSNGTSEEGKKLVLRIDESTGDLAPSTMADIYKQIYEDCETAITKFAESGMDREAGKVWHTNANVAHAVYARAALNKLDYAKAQSEAKLARQGYDLVSGDKYNDGFMRPNSEWIFGSYGDASENQWYWTYGTQFSCNGYYATNTANGGGSISIQLTDRIPDNDVRKGLFLTPDKFPSYNPESVFTAFLNYGLDAVGNSYVMKNEALYSEVDAYIKRMAVKNVTVPLKAGLYHVGDQIKFYVFDTPGVSYLPFIRSSEMVLIEAEAAFKQNKTSEAQAALNTLNAETGRTPGYSCTATGDALWQEIMDYRNLELWGEGFEWSDFKRWNRPVDRKSWGNGGNAHPAVAVKIATDAYNNWTWVVPQRETDYNKGFNVGETAE